MIRRKQLHFPSASNIVLGKSSSKKDDIREEKGCVLVCEEHWNLQNRLFLVQKQHQRKSGFSVPECLPTSNGDTILTLAKVLRADFCQEVLKFSKTIQYE